MISLVRTGDEFAGSHFIQWIDKCPPSPYNGAR